MATGPTTSSLSEENHQFGSPHNSNRKSWLELRNTVRSTRRLQTSLANRVPSEFVFVQKSTDQGPKSRLYFLGVPPGNKENTLLYSDLDFVNTQDLEGEGNQTLLNWCPLLAPFRGLLQTGFSKEEQLLRERKRLGSFGITAYDLDEAVGKFLFSACGSIFTCSDPNFSSIPVLPQEVPTQCPGARMDCKLCPANNDLIAFIHDKDIWVASIKHSTETRLTFTHHGNRNPALDPKSAGVATYIIQEEFDRYTGYWWQPVCSSDDPSSRPVYRILYEEVDESEVELMYINQQGLDSNIDFFRYPRAGTTNAKVTLKIAEFQLDDLGNICDVVEKSLIEPLDSIFPWVEYITRLGWTPDGKFVWAQLLQRNQLFTALILIPISSFVPVNDSHEEDDLDMMPNDPTVYVIYEEHSDIWINIHDTIHFFPQTNPDEISFLWASEVSCIRQLFYITALLQSREAIPGNLKPSLAKFQALTPQEGEVIGHRVWVDETKGLVYYKALHDTPLEEHIYVVSITDPQSPVRITPLGFSIHETQISSDFKYIVYNKSNLTTPPFCVVSKLEVTTINPLRVSCQQISKLMPPLFSPVLPCHPELFSYKSPTSRETIYGLIFKPPNMEPNKLYPVMHYVYGGPQVQLVCNAFQGMRAFRLYTFALMGYVAIMLDNRGSCKRGLKFEGYIKHKLGVCEVEDQVEGLKWIASQTGYMDLTRVAIHGWSYGGYMSLMCLAKRPDVFKVAVAGAPVTCWKSYDTGYTERYMDTPTNNPSGYTEGSVLHLVKNLPDEENRLLLVHGLIDENVHFHHTSLLVDKLVKECKPYQLQIYPQERHGIRKPDTNEHYETTVLSWLQQHL